jgi:hypothetical protein
MKFGSLVRSAIVDSVEVNDALYYFHFLAGTNDERCMRLLGGLLQQFQTSRISGKFYLQLIGSIMLWPPNNPGLSSKIFVFEDLITHP